MSATWRARLPGVAVLVVAVLLLFLPRVADNYVLYVMTRLFVYVLVALGLNLLTGYAGQVSLGHAAFFAIGAYTAAVLAERWQWPSLLCLVAAGAFTGAVGYLLGLPCLRLSGLYLAMATLGFERSEARDVKKRLWRLAPLQASDDLRQILAQQIDIEHGRWLRAAQPVRH